MKRVVLDATDFQIISALIRNGRAPFASIGTEVGLSPHAVADRVRRLSTAGVITGFTATVNLDSVGRGLDAMIDVRMMSAAKPEDFEQLVGSLPAVREICFLTGRFDYQLRVACRDADDLDHTVRAVRRGGGPQTETRIVLRSIVHRPGLE